MYTDYPPVVNAPIEQVVVLEKGDHDLGEVVDFARQSGATHEDGDGDEIFWIVFAEEPRRAWDFTENTLRQEMKRRARTS